MLKNSVVVLFVLVVLGLFSVVSEARTQVNLDVSVMGGPVMAYPAPAPMVVMQAPPPGAMVAMQVPPPPGMAMMMPPQGYSNCYVVPGIWMGNVWVPAHQECQYPQPEGMAMWVSGYWGCLAVRPDGGCGRWRWYGDRWVRGGEVAYYGRHGHHHHRNYW